jgi:hypothetical protein
MNTIKALDSNMPHILEAGMYVTCLDIENQVQSQSFQDLTILGKYNDLNVFHVYDLYDTYLPFSKRYEILLRVHHEFPKSWKLVEYRHLHGYDPSKDDRILFVYTKHMYLPDQGFRLWGLFNTVHNPVFLQIIRCDSIENDVFVYCSQSRRCIPMVRYLNYWYDPNVQSGYKFSYFSCRIGTQEFDSFQEIDEQVFLKLGIKYGLTYKFMIKSNHTLELCLPLQRSHSPSTFHQVFQIYLDTRHEFSMDNLRYEHQFIDLSTIVSIYPFTGMYENEDDPFLHIKYNTWFELQFPWVPKSKRDAFMYLFFGSTKLKDCYHLFKECNILTVRENTEWLLSSDHFGSYVELQYSLYSEYVSKKMNEFEASYHDLILKEHRFRENETQKLNAQLLVMKYKLVRTVCKPTTKSSTNVPRLTISLYNKRMKRTREIVMTSFKKNIKKCFPYFNYNILIYSQDSWPIFGDTYYTQIPSLESEMMINFTNKTAHIYLRSANIQSMNRMLTDIFLTLL